MSLRRTDVRFALPQPLRRAAVLGELHEWRDGLRLGGVEVVGERDDPDLVVAPRALARDAAATGAAMLVLEGTRRFSLPGYTTQTILPLPDADAPELLLPLGHAHAVRYAIRRWRPGATPAVRLRNTAARELLALGVAPPGRSPTVVAAREPGAPLAIAAAGLDAAEWFAAIGTFAHPHSRAAFFVFAAGEQAPQWVVKFSRVPGLEHLFELDERGLRLAERTGGVVADAAPRLAGRFELGGGLHASAETAATGERLGTLLRAETPRAERLAIVERLAAWIVDVARETAAAPPALDAELERIAGRVSARWDVPTLPPLPSVFVHGDLTADNVFVGEKSLTVVDWESAVPQGPPLWDLLYALAESLAAVDGARTDDERLEHAVRLFRGELESSRVLARWTRAAADASGVPDDAVGTLATLLWLNQAVVEADHVERLGLDVEPPMVRLAERWLTEPGLGPGWRLSDS